MSDAPELLPCPFCGGKARAIRSKLIRGAYEVQCKNSHINGLIWETAENAIAAWNRRTPSPEVAALIAEARREERERCVEIAVRHWEGEPEDTIAMAAEMRVGMKPLSDYEKKVAQMREDFPNGI